MTSVWRSYSPAKSGGGGGGPPPARRALAGGGSSASISSSTSGSELTSSSSSAAGGCSRAAPRLRPRAGTGSATGSTGGGGGGFLPRRPAVFLCPRPRSSYCAASSRRLASSSLRWKRVTLCDDIFCTHAMGRIRGFRHSASLQLEYHHTNFCENSFISKYNISTLKGNIHNIHN